MKNMVIEIVGWIFMIIIPVVAVIIGVEVGTIEWLMGMFLIGVGSYVIGQGILSE